MDDKPSTDFTFDIGLCIDFDDMEATEINLIELAHHAAMHDDVRTKAFGRALKTMAPAWIDFMKREMDRDEDGGPANCLVGLTKTFALLTAMVALPTCKKTSKARHLKALGEGVSALFTGDVNMLVGFFQEKMDAEKHASGQTH